MARSSKSSSTSAGLALSQSARLLDALADPERGFDAVVIGEPQRAFYGNQFGLTFPVFVHYGVTLWVPEVGGAIDPGSDAHDLVMSLYGGMSKGERNRIKTRVRAAKASQAAVEGRFLGGRPPYGYRLADAGPHPNPGKAAIGQRLHALEPDPKTADNVVRIFDEFLSGSGLYTIAEGLTRDAILSPSAHDPARNRHRASSKGVWSKVAVRSILQNPRYTGYPPRTPSADLGRSAISPPPRPKTSFANSKGSWRSSPTQTPKTAKPSTAS